VPSTNVVHSSVARAVSAGEGGGGCAASALRSEGGCKMASTAAVQSPEACKVQRSTLRKDALQKHERQGQAMTVASCSKQTMHTACLASSAASSSSALAATSSTAGITSSAVTSVGSASSTALIRPS